jgi:nucleotide-binding universal stress UspA family protein
MARTSKLLIGYDGSDSADAMLDDLRRAGLPRDGEALILSVGADVELPEGAAARFLTHFPAWTVRAEHEDGSPAKALLGTADSWGPGLLVVGSHGRSAVGRFLLGSVSHAVVAEAHCSVRVARRGMRPIGSPLRLVIGTDGSSNATAAVEEVASRPWPPGTEVRVVHAIWRYPEAAVTDVEHHEHAALQAAAFAAWESQRAKEIADGTAETLRAAGLATSTVVRAESGKRLLLDEATAWEADCVFVGATGLSPFDRLLMGSTATSVVTNAGCSVEVIRA